MFFQIGTDGFEITNVFRVFAGLCHAFCQHRRRNGFVKGFSCSKDVRNDDLIRIAEGFAEFIKQELGSAVCVGLEDAPCLVQAISEDGKLMITIAREEGVDWEPLKDLTARAYFLLSEDFQLPPVKIFLEKTSPVGAGLGGGSSDAAFALKMMNELCALGLSQEQLACYASRLGSDCAFFIYNSPMIGEGRGEILSPFLFSGSESGMEDVLPGYELKVLAPGGIAVSTADAYRGIKPRIPELALREALARPLSEWKDVLVNDFENTVFAKYPELAAIKNSLYESGAVYAAMSGSGSAMFAIYEKE